MNVFQNTFAQMYLFCDRHIRHFILEMVEKQSIKPFIALSFVHFESVFDLYYVSIFLFGDALIKSREHLQDHIVALEYGLVRIRFV